MSRSPELKNFEVPEAVVEELESITARLYRFCKEHEIPFMATFCLGVTDTDVNGATSVYFNGPDRTPDYFVTAYNFLMEGATMTDGYVDDTPAPKLH